MLQILEFVFASGWRFAGTVILILSIGLALCEFRPLSGIIIISRDD